MLIHDTVYVPAPVATVHDAIDTRAPGLLREAIDAMAAGPALALVGDLVGDGPRAPDAWPAPTLGEPRRHADRVLVPLVWTPAAANPLLQGFDGDLAYAPIAANLTQLTLSGTGATPRLDTSGAAIAERLAQFAVRAWLEALARLVGTA